MEDANTDLISTDSDHTTIKAIADSMVKAAEASNRLRLQEADEDDEDMLARDSSERVFNAEIVQVRGGRGQCGWGGVCPQAGWCAQWRVSAADGQPVQAGALC